MKKFFILVLSSALLMMFGCKKDTTTNELPTFTGDYIVLAWNDLGMHCCNPQYDMAVVLPPYNTIWAQVIKKGDPPQIVTTGIQVEYHIIDNTYSYGKRQYGGFWDNAEMLFGVVVDQNKGLTGNGLQGSMALDGDHFIVTGIPLTPVKDDQSWTPFQVGEITVKDDQGNVLITTRTTVPVSDEISCDKCHIATIENDYNPFLDILQKHDKLHTPPDGFLVPQAPLLCAMCHGSPPLGTDGPGDSGKYLSAAIHRAHSTRLAPDGSPIACYDCHPGQTTKCSRSLRHAREDGNCTTCHGNMLNVATTVLNGRMPWGSEPKCVDCHTGVTEVDTDTLLYRNSKGHGQIYCAACHGSPHVMFPAREPSDNYQAMQYQPYASRAKSISSCGTCHDNSRGVENKINGYPAVHGGTNPSTPNGCNLCHTNVTMDLTTWPHAYEWMNSNYTKTRDAQ